MLYEQANDVEETNGLSFEKTFANLAETSSNAIKMTAVVVFAITSFLNWLFY